jgi:hypothetical protein
MTDAQRQTKEIGLICGNMKKTLKMVTEKFCKLRLEKVAPLKIHLNFFWLIQPCVLGCIEPLLYKA